MFANGFSSTGTLDAKIFHFYFLLTKQQSFDHRESPWFNSFQSTKVNKDNLILFDTVSVVVVKYHPLFQIAQCIRRRMYCLNLYFSLLQIHNRDQNHPMLVGSRCNSTTFFSSFFIFPRFTFPTVQTFERSSAWVGYRLKRPKHTPVGFWSRLFLHSLSKLSFFTTAEIYYGEFL